MPPKKHQLDTAGCWKMGKGGGKFWHIFVRSRLGKEEIRNAVFWQRIFVGKKQHFWYICQIHEFCCLYPSFFWWTLPLFFLVNAKIFLPNPLICPKGPRTHKAVPPLFSLPDWGPKKKVFTFGKDSQGHLNQETSCHILRGAATARARLWRKTNAWNMTATTRCLPLESTSCDARHTEFEDDIRSYPFFRVSVSPQYLILRVPSFHSETRLCFDGFPCFSMFLVVALCL